MSKRIAVLLLSLAVLASSAPSSDAGPITFSIANETPVIPGQYGSFDVVVSQPGGGNSLYQFQFDLFVQQGASNIQFIGNPGNPGTAPNPAGTSNIEDTVAPYVFAGNSGISGLGDVQVFPGPNGNEVSISDEVNNNATAPALSSTLLAMAHVVFFVPADTPAGSYALTFNQDNLGTDPFADFVELTSNATQNYVSPDIAINGAIVITGPEPGSAALLLLGAAGLLWAARRRR